jgi:hypothetical protein
MLKTKDVVKYTRTNGEIVQGRIERLSRKHQAVYIRDIDTDRLVAASMNRVQKL